MNDGGVRTAVEALVGADLSAADRAGLSDAARAVARLQSFVDHAKVQIARRGRQLADAGDSSSTIRNQHRPDSDVEELDRQRAASGVKRWTDRDTGMKNTLVSLDPIRDASLWNVIDHHLARLRSDPANVQRPFGQLQVEAVLASVDASTDGRRRIPEIVAHVDHRSLCHGRHADTLSETADGTAVPVATVQRLCCEAIIQAVVVQPDGSVDQLCAEQRTANHRQRHARSHVLDVRPPALQRLVHGVPYPPHRVVDQGRNDRAGELTAALRGPPPSRPRGWMGPPHR